MGEIKTGKHAERDFATLCSREGITCNNADEDDKAWDHFIQYGSPASFGSELEDAARAFIQTKSQRGTFKGISLKLSNALEFCRNRDSCFVVVFLYTAAGVQRQDVALLHFWQKEIEHALRMRQKQIAEGRIDHHKIHLHLKKTDFQLLNREVLIKEIMKIRDSDRNYCRNKEDFVNKVGYGDVTHRGVLEFEGNVSDIIDMQIGLKNEIPATIQSLESVRFGIGVPDLAIGSGRQALISMRAKPHQGTLVLSSEAIPMVVEAQCSVLMARIPGLRFEDSKVRIQSDCADIIVMPKDRHAEINFSWRFDRPCAFDLALERAIVALIVQSGPFRLSLRREDVRMELGRPDLKTPPPHASLQSICDFLNFLAEHTQSRERLRRAQVTVAELAADVRSVGNFLSLARGGPETVSGIYVDGAPRYEGLAFLYYYVPYQINEYSIFAVVRKSGNISANGDELVWTKTKDDYVHIYCHQGEVDQGESLMDSELSFRVREMSSHAVINLRNIMRSMAAE